MERIEVQKFELTDGQELNDFISMVMKAVTQQRKQLNRSLGLMGIYKNHIITRDMESGKFFKLAMKHDANAIELGDPAEVRQVFVPVTNVVEKSLSNAVIAIQDGKVYDWPLIEQDTEEVIAQLNKRASDYVYAEAPKDSMWKGVI